MQTQDYLKELLLKHIDGTIAPAEKRTLFELLDNEEQAADWKAVLLDMSQQAVIDANYSEREWETVIQQILNTVQGPVYLETPVRRMNRFWWAAAAVILMVLSIGGYWLWTKNEAVEIAKTETQKPADIAAPKSTKARITLADGTTVALDSINAGTLATQGAVKLLKNAKGEIIYTSDNKVVPAELQYNTLNNPRGSQVIDMTLSDGSHIWLNAGSSVTYPVTFTGNDRTVAITGEAYFEVAHDASRPFIVSKGDIKVQVLGTHFNVNAYDDENDIKVTLLEGSVKVNNGSANGLLKPGQQALVAGDVKVVDAVDLDAVMAWKNGKFVFADATVESVMKQVSRWYDVEIEYQGEKPTVHFIGDMSRLENVSEVLKMLQQTGAVKCSIEGRKVIVRKN